MPVSLFRGVVTQSMTMSCVVRCDVCLTAAGRDGSWSQVVIVLWTTGVPLQTLITKHTYKATGMAVAETLQMVGCSSSRADVLELCAAVLHVKSGYDPPSFCCVLRVTFT